MNSLPNESMSLAEAGAHLGIAVGTLRDLLKNNRLPTSTERRKSARGVRQMVVLCPDTIQRLESLLKPLPASPEPLEPREGAIHEVEAPYTPARASEIGEPLRSAHSGSRRTMSPLIDLESAEPAAPIVGKHRAQLTRYVAVQVRLGRGRWLTIFWHLSRAIRSPIAVWIVQAGRIVLACILYFLAPRAVAMAMMPSKPAINASNVPTRRRAA